jgi:hypothetical protein
MQTPAPANIAVCSEFHIEVGMPARWAQDGNNHQIDRLKKEAKTRGIKVTILIDLVHVLEYLWGAAWSFFDEGDPAAETWVHDKALAVLQGKAGMLPPRSAAKPPPSTSTPINEPTPTAPPTTYTANAPTSTTPPR